MKNLLQSVLLLLLTTTLATAQIRITEVDPMGNKVKIKNFSTSMANVSNYVLCDNASNYPKVTSVGGPINLMANQEVTLSLSSSTISLSTASGNVALYKNSTNYSMTANMIDFFQWGAASGGRESVAVMKGIWMMSAFVMTPGAYTYTGNGMDTGNRMPLWQNGMGTGGGAMGMMVIPHVDKLLFASRIDGGQAGITTNATGLGSFLLNKTRDTLCYNINVNGLSGPISAIHLHQAAMGQNGSVVVNLSGGINGNTVSGTLTGADLSNNLMSFLKGEIYVNVHTSANPSGEVRGQVKLETDFMFKGELSAAAHVHNVNLNGKNPVGLITLGLSQDKKTINYMVVGDSLTGNLQMATFMYGKPGKVGGMVYNETSNIMMGMPVVMGSIDVAMNPNFVDSLMGGSVYVNLTTMANPSGELRGQLMMDKNTLPLDIMLDSSQVMGSSVSGADPMGLGLVSINYSFDTLKYDVLIWGLSGAMTNVMLLDATDMNNMLTLMNITTNVNGNRITGMITGANLTDNIIELALKGDICFRAATTLNPMGEAAGHITKFARDGFVFSLDGAQVAPNSTNSNATGTAILSLNRTWMDAHYMFNANGLGSNFTTSKFRLGGVTETGMMEKEITNNASANGNGLFAAGFWKSTDATLPFMPVLGNHLVADSIYLEINTMNETMGEIRGQSNAGLACAEKTIGIDDLPKTIDKVVVFPNPSSGISTVRVELSTPTEINLKIYDAMGKLQQAHTINGSLGVNKISLNLRALPNGIYTINVTTGFETRNTKLMILN